jgi:nucleoside-diphosphate-sugar epimerase
VKVCITGAAGFIGSNLAKRCIDEGWTVVGVDDMSNGHVEFIPKGIERFYHSCLSKAPTLKAIRSQEFDVVFHLAAMPRVSYSVEHPVQTNDANLTKTLMLLDACRGNVGRVVFASSSSVYGGADQLPTPETTRKDPKSPYALQKSLCEEYLKLYHELYGLDSAAMRFFNVFGRNALGSSAYATAIAAWMTAIKSGLALRSDGDGSQSRDLCHVDNVTHALMLAAKHPGSLNAEAFNVACGTRTTNKEILDFLLERYPNAKVNHAPWRAGDVMHTQADITKIEGVLGYEVQKYVWEGIIETVEWFEQNWSWISGLKAGI